MQLSGLEVWLLVRRWAWLGVLGLVAGAAVAFLVSAQLPKMYAAQAKLLVTAGDTGVLSRGESLTPDQALATYTQVLESRPVVEAAIAAAGVPLTYEEALNDIDVSPTHGTQILVVTFAATNPTAAAALANQLGSAAVDQARSTLAAQLAARRAQAADARSLSEQDLAAARTGDPLSVVETALPPTIASRPRVGFNMAIGALIGLLVAVGAALAVELIRDRLTTPAAVRRRTGLPVWGSVPRARTKSGAEPRSIEAFRALRTTVQRVLVSRPTVVLVASSRPGEGTTTTASGLAVALARAGERVVLVDANVRTPLLASQFGVKSHPNLIALLGAEPTIEAVSSALCPTSVDGLLVLTCEPERETARDLVASRRMEQLIALLCTLADRVIVDGAPVSAGETLALAHCVDATVLVINADRSRGSEAQRSAAAIRGATQAVGGAVLSHT
jgi:capsular exopolysaccharide synthesis family protein